MRAVIAESFERIHRSNLIGMGVIPLQFPEGESAASLKLDGTETFDITGIEDLNDGKTPKTVHVTATKEGADPVEFDAVVRIDTPARPITTATAASCSSCCATCSRRSSPGIVPVPRVTDDHLAARRRQILDGARRCFAEYGYENATVRRLEQTIGLSRGAIFHHFRDKDTLFFELAREDAERMADVAAREGLIQVMRELLAAPDQFDWLATRLEIARKLRNDPAFSRGWAERSAELSAATSERLRRQKQAGRLRDDVPGDVLRSYLELVLDGLVARLASGMTRTGSARCSTSSRIPCGSAESSRLTPPVVGSAAAAHGGAGFPQHAVDRAVGMPGRRDETADARTALVRAAELADQLVPALAVLLHRRLPQSCSGPVTCGASADTHRSGQLDEIPVLLGPEVLGAVG